MRIQTTMDDMNKQFDISDMPFGRNGILKEEIIANAARISRLGIGNCEKRSILRMANGIGDEQSAASIATSRIRQDEEERQQATLRTGLIFHVCISVEPLTIH